MRFKRSIYEGLWEFSWSFAKRLKTGKEFDGEINEDHAKVLGLVPIKAITEARDQHGNLLGSSYRIFPPTLPCRKVWWLKIFINAKVPGGIHPRRRRWKSNLHKPWTWINVHYEYYYSDPTGQGSKELKWQGMFWLVYEEIGSWIINPKALLRF